MNRNKLVKLKPPFILLGLLIIAFVLHSYTFLGTIMIAESDVVGWIFIAIGTLIMFAAQKLFRSAKTTIIPAERPSTFVVTGPYKFTRNPMYVAGALLTLGIAMFVGTLPFFLAWVIMYFVLNHIHIPFEEEQLEDIFGEEYLDYKQKVRRWL